MNKQIRNAKITWDWSGDEFALERFNVVLTPSGGDPRQDATVYASAGTTKNTNGLYEYIFRDITVDTANTYVAWVQAVYENEDSDWLSTSTLVIEDDGTPSIASLDEVDTVAAGKVQTFIDGQYTTDKEALQTQIDGKIETWFTSTDPETNWSTAAEKEKHHGDMWYNGTSNQLKRYNWDGSAGSWILIQDQKAIDAYDNASKAQDTADEKRRIFTSTPTTPYDVGDMWAQGEAGDMYVCHTAKLGTESYSVNDWEKAADYATGTEYQNFVDSMTQNMTELQNQLDGNITTWFMDGVPSLTNQPYTDWETEDNASTDDTDYYIRDSHLGDIYYDNVTGTAYRFTGSTGSYSWTEITDNALTEALTTARGAEDLADQKRRVFVNTPTTPYDVGDLWTEGESGDLYRCITPKSDTGSYSSLDWEKAVKYTDDTTVNTFIDGTFADTVDDLTGQIDGKIDTWFGPTDPSTSWAGTDASHEGDLWYDNTAGSQKLKRWDGASWNEITDQKAIDAMEAAGEAQGTADKKKTIFTNEPVSPYDVGDMWWLGPDNVDMKICTTADGSTGNFTASHWELATNAEQYTKDLTHAHIVNPNTTYLFHFNKNITSTDGVGPNSGYDVNLHKDGGKFGGAAEVVSSLSYNFGSLTDYTISVYYTSTLGGSFDHYVIKSNGEKYVNGERNDGATTSFMTVSAPNITLNTGVYDELMVSTELNTETEVKNWYDMQKPFFDPELTIDVPEPTSITISWN